MHQPYLGPRRNPHTFAPDTHFIMQDQAEKHVREAAAQGANIILLQVRLGQRVVRTRAVRSLPEGLFASAGC